MSREELHHGDRIVFERDIIAERLGVVGAAEFKEGQTIVEEGTQGILLRAYEDHALIQPHGGKVSRIRVQRSAVRKAEKCPRCEGRGYE